MAAEVFQQENPQITDDTGNYSFLVPPGDYFIAVSAKNYNNYVSDEFKVRFSKNVIDNIELKRPPLIKRVINWFSGALGRLF